MEEYYAIKNEFLTNSCLHCAETSVSAEADRNLLDDQSLQDLSISHFSLTNLKKMVECITLDCTQQSHPFKP